MDKFFLTACVLGLALVVGANVYHKFFQKGTTEFIRWVNFGRIR